MKNFSVLSFLSSFISFLYFVFLTASYCIAGYLTTGYSIFTNSLYTTYSDKNLVLQIVIGTGLYYLMSVKFSDWILNKIKISDDYTGACNLIQSLCNIDRLMSFVLTVMVVVALGLKDSAVNYLLALNNVTNEMQILAYKLGVDILIYWSLSLATITKISLQRLIKYKPKNAKRKHRNTDNTGIVNNNNK